jgi:GH25 family lysozyme M1 (1,4-beta-N-acetylmuramidase)
VFGEDTNLDVNVPNAKNRGLLTGVYHHTSPLDNNNQFVDPIVDADTFVDCASQYMGAGYLRPVVDVEEDATLNSNGYNINTWAAAFINRVQQRVGVAPMIYTTGAYAEFFLDATAVAASPDVWIAIHASSSDPITTNSQPTFNGNVGPGAWRNTTPTPQQSWDFWQYSGTGNGKGALYGSAGTPISI